MLVGFVANDIDAEDEVEEDGENEHGRDANNHGVFEEVEGVTFRGCDVNGVAVRRQNSK